MKSALPLNQKNPDMSGVKIINQSIVIVFNGCFLCFGHILQFDRDGRKQLEANVIRITPKGR